MDPRSEAARRESAIQTLISQRDQAIDDLKATRGQLATMTEVARGNKRHVTYLVEENEALRAEVARVRADVAEEIAQDLTECAGRQRAQAAVAGSEDRRQLEDYATAYDNAAATARRHAGKGLPGHAAALPDVASVRGTSPTGPGPQTYRRAE